MPGNFEIFSDRLQAIEEFDRVKAISIEVVDSLATSTIFRHWAVHRLDGEELLGTGADPPPIQRIYPAQQAQ